MKILNANYKKGIVKIVPTTLDDLWHLYNIILKGDRVFTRTSREIKTNAEYSRPQKGKRVSVFLGVKAEEIAWNKNLNRLRVHGRISDAPEDIAGKGSHHTLKIKVNKPLTIVKNRWEKHQVDRLKAAAKAIGEPLIVISIDSEEYCLAVIRQYGVDVRAEKRAGLPGKLEARMRAEALNKYFSDAMEALKKTWMSTHCSIVVIGVGFTKNHFVKYLRSRSHEISERIADVKSVNSSGVAGINEALRSGVLDKALRHLRVAEEAQIVEKLLARLGKERNDVSYGQKQVEKASSYGAVETLLVADTMIRDTEDERRLSLETLIRGVEEKKGRVTIINSEHEAGQKLLSLGGIAALLRFPID